jgi:hypothetical protein
MLTEPLVLILGAGASLPYGFPSGPDLTSLICRELKRPESYTSKTFYGSLIDCGFSPSSIEEFRSRLDLSFLYSIDAFLEHQPRYLDIGKVAITRALIPCEKEDRLYRENVERNWYQYLFNKIDVSPDQFDKLKLSVITFNYDRSLEKFLFLGLKNRYGLSDTDAVSLVDAIPIVHVHGDLGALPGTKKDGEEREYDPDWTPHLLLKTAKRIKIIHEDTEDTSELLQARKIILENVGATCFLGFGYHARNITRLGFSLQGHNRRKHLYGTTFNMKKTDRQLVHSLLSHPFTDADCDCLEALGSWDLIR